MLKTTFDTPHGLSNTNSLSNAYEIAILTYHCMQIDIFKKVVKTPYYEVDTGLM